MSFSMLNQIPNKDKEAQSLAFLIQEYEEKVHPNDSADPILAHRIRKEEIEMKDKNLAAIIGSKGIVLEVLNK